VTTKSARCRGCHGLAGDPRIERGKLVWVCRRCGNRTEIVCAQCETRFSSPGRQGVRFTAWCSPCGASVKLDATGTEQRREVLSIPKKPEPEPEPEPPEAEEPIDESDGLGDADGVQSDAIVFSVESVDGDGYRASGRVVELVCPPRQFEVPISLPSRFARLAVFTAIPAGILAVVYPPSLPSGAAGWVSAGSLVLFSVIWSWVLFIKVVGNDSGICHVPSTRACAGPNGLEVEPKGHEGWRTDAHRVQRVFTTADPQGGVGVRVQLDDGTERYLLAGLSEEEAQEVVAQVDRALPGRHADL